MTQRFPSLDLMDSSVLQWRNAEWEQRILARRPVHWPDVFGNSHPMDMEIGIGNGSFLVPFAAHHPERNIVGIEIDGKYLKKADRRLMKQQLPNARLLIGDAKLLIWGLFPDESIEDLYVLFPDPWFKKRHKKRRMIQPVMLKMFARKIRRYLVIATDDEEYKDWVLDSIAESGCFNNTYDTPWVEAPEEHFMTKYEKKWRGEGRKVYYMRFCKITQPDFDENEYILTQNLRFPLSRLREKYEANIPIFK